MDIVKRITNQYFIDININADKNKNKFFNRLECIVDIKFIKKKCFVELIDNVLCYTHKGKKYIHKMAKKYFSSSLFNNNIDPRKINNLSKNIIDTLENEFKCIYNYFLPLINNYNHYCTNSLYECDTKNKKYAAILHTILNTIQYSFEEFMIDSYLHCLLNSDKNIESCIKNLICDESLQIFYPENNIIDKLQHTITTHNINLYDISKLLLVISKIISCYKKYYEASMIDFFKFILDHNFNANIIIPNDFLDLHMFDNTFTSLLKIAVYHDNIDMIKLILKYNVDINCVDENYIPIVIYSIIHNKLNIFRYLITCDNVNINLQYKYRYVVDYLVNIDCIVDALNLIKNYGAKYNINYIKAYIRHECQKKTQPNYNAIKQIFELNIVNIHFMFCEKSILNFILKYIAITDNYLINYFLNRPHIIIYNLSRINYCSSLEVIKYLLENIDTKYLHDIFYIALNQVIHPLNEQIYNHFPGERVAFYNIALELELENKFIPPSMKKSGKK